MEELQKALQEQGAKTEDVSAYLLPAWPSLVLPSNPPFSPPPCCPMSDEGHCEYHGSREAHHCYLPSFSDLVPRPLTPRCFFSPAHAAEEEAGRSPVSAEHLHSWVGTLGTKMWRIVGEETQSAQVKYSLYFETGCCVTEAGLEFLTTL